VKIATIEAPIEAKLPGVMQTLIQPDETNPEKSAKEFNKAIQALVRANPDYLNLGEIKSAASADAAFQMGDTGVLTFATVHSKSV
ncbi:ATPase, T2SS/T4P/T4SS family, partial [Streptomyces galilaeus]|uniref:ATPase, T2SS/T4P/T4SS family n=1 Tax=Streptomyces galilaeus TaxID=33899 RepID=UPI0038F81FD9